MDVIARRERVRDLAGNQLKWRVWVDLASWMKFEWHDETIDEPAANC
jgi:hypothetical protein